MAIDDLGGRSEWDAVLRRMTEWDAEDIHVDTVHHIWRFIRFMSPNTFFILILISTCTEVLSIELFV